jgi:hypothetical protein
MKLLAAAFAVLLFSSVFSSSFAFPDYSNRVTPKPQISQTPEIVQIPSEATQQHDISRYLVFGRGPIDETILQNQVSSVSSDSGFFSIVIMPDQAVPSLNQRGYSVMRDFQLEFHDELYSEMDTVRKSTGSELSKLHYNYTGAGVTIAIVDTGVDFSNPDVSHSLARDKNNHPIMLDPDGQGIILTNATFIANINKLDQIQNATKPFIEEKNKSLSKNATSTVYVTKSGVFLNLKQKGKGTPVSIYNSLYPTSGPYPVFNGTITDDYKIGKTNRDFIRSASGVYHFGIMYQGITQGIFASIQAVPVLVVDSRVPGIYDTIIPDLSTSWKDYTRFDLKRGEKPNYDFDFTDETPIRLGSGNEFLVYDSNKDGKLDYSAGTVGARILDIYGVISQNKSAVDKIIKATNGTLLLPIDPAGNYFGVMTDFVGHGTAAAASISSKGKERYDIYNNTKKFTLPGVAPNAKILPVKALWFGDTVYGWLWAAGFDNKNNTWEFSGMPRADIISNSWGISTFPSLKTSPGIDILSIVTSVLSTPQSVDPRYPGVTIVSSAGNAGHGYGTLGLPNASPFGITVGATTNNVYVGYGTFKGQPRFGNTTVHANDMVDFSSRGPSVIGDPKPDLVDTGAYGFVPSNVLKAKKDSKLESFSMFGGTSMAAPLVAGSAAILMEGLKEKDEDYTPFRIKNILMSTATDLGNDPFVQGSGLVNSYGAAKFLDGKDVFAVYNDATYQNVREILEMPIKKINSTAIGLGQFGLPDRDQPQTSWFAGRLAPGEKSTARFTIENPGDHHMTVQIDPQRLELIQKTELNSTTKLKLKDSLYNKTDVYRPDYIELGNVRGYDSLAEYYRNATIPGDSELMILNLSFSFSDFMNKTEKMYGADTKIASLYLYDWNDKNRDESASSDELSLVNRGGSWGTVQELRVSDPASKFEGMPLAGVYPVPTRYSYWAGDTKKNSTEIDYLLTASHYKKETWPDIWLESGLVKVKPKSTAQVLATVTVPENARPGIYQGFLKFSSENHTVNAPVSYAVSLPVSKKDTLAVIPANKNTDVLYGNGYVRGAFDMVNRYNAGDWRQYYFEIEDSAINAASIDISWEKPDTNLSVFVIDPQGRLVQTNMPPGVFGHLMDWPTSDWLGTSLFSEGGGFYPVKNKDQTSTVLYAPINQTGTYSLLLHSTLFGGPSPAEPFTVVAQFSTILADRTSPQISWDQENQKLPQITDESEFSVRYWLDGVEVTPETIQSAGQGTHEIKVEATDVFGNTSTQSRSFTVYMQEPESQAETQEPRVDMQEPQADMQDKDADETNGIEAKAEKPRPAQSGQPETGKLDSNFVLLSLIGAAAIAGASIVAFATKKSKKR